MPLNVIGPNARAEVITTVRVTDESRAPTPTHSDSSEGSLRPRAVVVETETRFYITRVFLAIISGVSKCFIFMFTRIRGCMPRATYVSPVDRIIQSEYEALQPEVEELRRRIRRIDDFVSRNPELCRIFQETLRDYGRYYEICIPPDESYAAPIEGEEPLARLSRLGHKQVVLEHHLRERMRLITSHPRLLRSFKQHMLLDSHFGVAEKVSPGPIIEEVDESDSIEGVD